MTGESSTPAGAVFLSYASEDAEAAQRICEALRSASVEVWFDRNELRGGDAWDQSIRKQIKTCALFVPVISHHTHDRKEGYFRLEWNLALDRSRLISTTQAFFVPVVIDDTREDDEEVPERIRDIHWTRLPGGVTPSVFVERVQRLLSGGTLTPGGAYPAREAIAATARSKRVLPVVAVLVILGVVAYLSIEKPWASKPLAATAAAFAPPPHSVAVLPFVNMSSEREQEYFSDGLSEELIDMLTKIPDLRVPARTSSFYFKGKSETIANIARTLGVANVLEGSVRKAGNQLRVTAQLIRADNGYHVWSETYNRELKDVFKVQDDIAGAVVSALKVKLSPERRNSARGTTNTEAYTQYLLGRQLYHRANNTDGYQQSIAAYQKATALDPNYAAAYAGLAVAKAVMADFVGDAVKGIEAARADAETAVALSPEQPEGYSARGFLRMNWDWDWTGAQGDFEKALSLDPSSAEAQTWNTDLLATLGRLPAAIAAEKRGIELDPLRSDAWRRLAALLGATGQRAAAVQAIHRALEIQPEDMYAISHLAQLQLTEGKAAEAVETYRKVAYAGFRLPGIAMAECRLGHVNESERALAEAAVKAANEAAYQIAQGYAWCGDMDRSFQWLGRAYRQRDSALALIKWDPLVASLRGDPRYVALLRKMNLPQD